MSDFVEDLTIQSLQRKLKTAMEIADSATIIVLEREKQIKDLEQQLKTANELIDELCNDYEPEIKAKYEGTLNFPCRQRDYDADMDVINRARKCLAE